jgi:hypothetical protein
MNTPGQQTAYCSELSLQAGESLPGSATRTTGFFLLEYNGTWAAKAFEESDIPQEVKAFWKNYSRGLPEVKLLLIHRPHQTPGLPIHFFVACTEENRPQVHAFELQRYEELLDLDLNGILNAAPQFQPYRRSEPLFLVCTNGRRDACCARRGTAVFTALDEIASAGPNPLVWKSTHMGGHRFAANVLLLPHGLLYGRVDPENALAILAAYQQGHMVLPSLRGRTCYPPVAQAAEILLRQEIVETSLNALRLLDVHEIPPLAWQVDFISQKTSDIYHCMVQEEELAERVFESCTLDKSTPITHYHIRSVSI